MAQATTWFSESEPEDGRLIQYKQSQQENPTWYASDRTGRWDTDAGLIRPDLKIERFGGAGWCRRYIDAVLIPAKIN
jgi:hypothetical protein